jgi:hypothetical protein
MSWSQLRVLAVLALPLLAAGSAAGAVPATGSTGPTLSATLEQCLTAPAQADRSATFTGQMETIAEAHRMAMQIVVQERTPGDTAFHTLDAPGLNVWQRSETGVKIYKDVRQVTDLPAPAVFRALVLYRWLNERGRIVKSAARRTAVCRQPAAAASGQPAPAATMH